MGIGVAIGWLSTKLKPDSGRTDFLESIAIAVFGAFIGGEFIAVLMRSDPKDTGISLMTIALAAACSVITLMLLQLMRRAVGPLRSGKPKRSR